MEKWADFGVFVATYAADGTTVLALEVRRDIGSCFREPRRLARADVLRAMERGKTFVTVDESAGAPVAGPKLRKVVVEGRTYLRTDDAMVEADAVELLAG